MNPSCLCSLCEKYALVDNPLLLEGDAQYELFKRYEKGYLFRNTQFLPFGLTFDRYVTEDAFRKLPADEKPALLLQAVVLPNESEGKKQGLTQVELSDLQLDPRNFLARPMRWPRAGRRLSISPLSAKRASKGRCLLDQRSILVLQTPFDRGWHAFQDGKAVPVTRVDVGLLGVGLDAGEHKVELRYRNPVLVPALAISLVSFLILGTSLVAMAAARPTRVRRDLARTCVTR